MRSKDIATFAGWLVGAALAGYVVVPVAADIIHAADDVYAPPFDVAATCLPDGTAVVSARSRKLATFTVSRDEPGYLLVRYDLDGQPFGLAHPLVRPDRNVVATQPIYVVGDEFPVGPFLLPALPSGAAGVTVTVVLPGDRFGFHHTRATIGPLPAINCTG